jgi:molybdate transport system regulatory protein
MSEHPLVSLKLRLRCGDLFAMGPGKADLLEAIQETASIAAAGRKLGLSYWKTRHLLEEMNRCFRLPVVVASKGGDKGGGAQVSETGRLALARFRAMEAEAGSAIAARVLAFQELLADVGGNKMRSQDTDV